ALGKVTVTARRREEDSQKVPTPITVLGGETLEAQRISRVQDLQQVLPSVNVAYIHARQSSVAVRGIGNNPASDGLEGSAGIYLDNVYLGRPGMAVFDLLDIEQLELLRGPQGTLFGKNTTAGVLNISTRAPTFTAERTVEVSGGQDGYFQGRGTVSGPLGETLAGRLSAYRTRDDGYIKNIHDDNYLNGGERQGARGQLLFEPNEDFSLRWIADYNEEDSSNGSMVVYGGAERFWQRAALVGASPLRDPQRRKVNINGRQHVSVHQGGSSLEANWNLAGGYRLTSISAYRYWHFTPANDEQLNVSAINDTGVEVHDRQFSQEIRLASPTGGAFDYVVGAYAFRQNLGNKTFTSYGPLADLYLLGANLGALNDTYSKANGKIETDSFALFAQGTWHLTERLDFTAGLRGTYEEKNAKVERFAPLGGAAVGGVGAAVRNGQLGAYDSGDLSQYNFAPSALLSLSYQFSDDLLADLEQDLRHVHGRRLGSIFFGGGTPSLFSAKALGRLLEGVERRVGFADGIEITLEANPGTFEQVKFADYRRLGINRLSIGVQSFQADKLQALGRIHDGAEAVRAADMARQAGFDNFNLDLMHGLPGQSLDDALADLRQALALAPTHLSWYQLTMEPNTVFWSQPPELPEDDILWDIQEAGQALLDEHGYRQYETSAYARDGLHARHNLNYWSFGDFLGIGAGAHAKLSAPDGRIVRTWKTRLPKDYLNPQKAFQAGERPLEAADLPFEFMMN
ncbi:radical SAM family heme chaperone HemW, partial [Pseudomonas aeruginosa]|nr:radical SAM family heme chaperone HemW [Pseudomonas aeruginosa]